MFMCHMVHQEQMLQKFGLQGQESIIYAIIIRIYLSGF